MQIRIQAAKRTLLGRILCRLAGEQTGAVMMEYVILCTLIAAAAVLGVTFFGKHIVAGFGVIMSAVTGDNKSATAQATANQTTAVTDGTAAQEGRQIIAPAGDK